MPWEPALSAWEVCGTVALPPADSVICGDLGGLSLSDRDARRSFGPAAGSTGWQRQPPRCRWPEPGAEVAGSHRPRDAGPPVPAGGAFVIGVVHADIKRMRDQVFFEGPERSRRLSRYWLL